MISLFLSGHICFLSAVFLLPPVTLFASALCAGVIQGFGSRTDLMYTVFQNWSFTSPELLSFLPQAPPTSSSGQCCCSSALSHHSLAVLSFWWWAFLMLFLSRQSSFQYDCHSFHADFFFFAAVLSSQKFCCSCTTF